MTISVTRAGRLSGALTALLVLALVATVAPASATITTSDFPPRSTVKARMDGVDRWYVSGGGRPIGASPAGCRSDRQMLAPAERRLRGYYGPLRGRPDVLRGEVTVEAYRYASASAAAAAVRNNASYPDRCPRVREWYCNECDGVSTVWREHVSMPRVGVESTAWRYRGADNFKHTGYTVVARRGATVVRVSTGRVRLPSAGPSPYPRLVTKDLAEGIARLALRAALPG